MRKQEGEKERRREGEKERRREGEKEEERSSDSEGSIKGQETMLRERSERKSRRQQSPAKGFKKVGGSCRKDKQLVSE